MKVAVAVRDLDGREHLVSPWGQGGMLARDWAPDDKAVLGSWFEEARWTKTCWRSGPSVR